MSTPTVPLQNCDLQYQVAPDVSIVDYTTVHSLMENLINNNNEMVKNLGYQESHKAFLNFGTTYYLQKYAVNFSGSTNQQCTCVNWNSTSWNCIEITTNESSVATNAHNLSPSINFDLQMVNILEQQLQNRSDPVHPPPAVTLHHALVAYPNALVPGCVKFAPTRRGLTFASTLMNPFKRMKTLLQNLNQSEMSVTSQMDNYLLFVDNLMNELFPDTSRPILYAVKSDRIALFDSFSSLYTEYPLFEHFTAITGHLQISSMFQNGQYAKVLLFKGCDELAKIFAVSNKTIKSLLP